MLESLKPIQYRYPQLRIMGFHSGSSIHSALVKTRVVQSIMEEYITFPIFLSDKNYFGMKNEASYILFKDFRNPVLYHGGNLDLEILNKAVQELHEQSTGSTDNETSMLQRLKGSWSKQAEVMKEPYSCSLLQNFLLYFPGIDLFIMAFDWLAT
uniref:Catalytic n=1 Tax=Rhizophora mucronata TaxID=61149 RepID=A0A2P2LJF0_RHIMU